MLHNSPNKSYFKIWHRAFTNNVVMAECQNIMQMFEILMIVPSMNAIVVFVQRAFESKTEFCNRLSSSILDIRICVPEKKSLASKISGLIALSIIVGQKRKDISSHVHIIILQKSILF